MLPTNTKSVNRHIKSQYSWKSFNHRMTIPLLNVVKLSMWNCQILEAEGYSFHGRASLTAIFSPDPNTLRVFNLCHWKIDNFYDFVLCVTVKLSIAFCVRPILVLHMLFSINFNSFFFQVASIVFRLYNTWWNYLTNACVLLLGLAKYTDSIWE